MPSVKAQLREKGHFAFYESWCNMRRRCEGKVSPDVKRRYHDAGISYPDSWKTFKGLQEDMYETYRPGLTLERIDNSKGYFKENCKWATYKEQANNRKTNRLITINGITKL